MNYLYARLPSRDRNFGDLYVSTPLTLELLLDLKRLHISVQRTGDMLHDGTKGRRGRWRGRIHHPVHLDCLLTPQANCMIASGVLDRLRCGEVAVAVGYRLVEQKHFRAPPRATYLLADEYGVQVIVWQGECPLYQESPVLLWDTIKSIFEQETELKW